MEFEANDTIVGQATPPGEGGVGIVRMSGPRAREIAERLCPGLSLRPWRIAHARVADPATHEGIDEVLVSYMRAPRSYTREDVVEINCHGGQVPVARVLRLCMREGARLADPGEFTRRAFLSGRIDLAQAEAVLDLIRARTEEAERIALGQLSGGLSREVTALRERLASALAHLEAHIDFPEDEIDPRDAGALREAAGALAGDIEALAATFDDGRLFREGVRTAIVGRPNVGKSSLLNALLGRDRAIVTETPGTTRDVIEETLNVGGLPLRIMDTAGIREAHEMAEAEGVRRSLRAMDEADLVLLAVESCSPLHEADRELMHTTLNRKSILVLTKADLPRACGEVGDARPRVEVSARTGEGLDALREAIRRACLAGAGGEARPGVLVTALRHREALDRAADALRAAVGGLGASPCEITALDMRAALDALGEIVGAVTTDDILDRIFSQFCIGK